MLLSSSHWATEESGKKKKKNSKGELVYCGDYIIWHRSQAYHLSDPEYLILPALYFKVSTSSKMIEAVPFSFHQLLEYLLVHNHTCVLQECFISSKTIV